MLKNILQIVTGLFFLGWAYWFSDESLKPELYGMSIGIGAALIIEIIFFSIKEWKYLMLIINTKFLNRNQAIRISNAYLFKIECRGKYLLVKNSRFNNITYQPVGGVYKYFHPETNTEFRELMIEPDNNIDNDHKSEHDMRIKMLSRKHLRDFITWFAKNKNREADPWREFYEELVATNILSNDNFRFIYYNQIGKHFEPIHLDPQFNIDTYKYVDIYSPRFVNHAQELEMSELRDKVSDDFIWVTEDEIRKKMSKNGMRISDHSYKIFLNN